MVSNATPEKDHDACTSGQPVDDVQLIPSSIDRQRRDRERGQGPLDGHLCVGSVIDKKAFILGRGASLGEREHEPTEYHAVGIRRSSAQVKSILESDMGLK